MVTLPLFKNIHISSFDIDDVEHILQKYHFYNYPTYITIDQSVDPDEILELLDNIALFFKRNNISPTLPFPTYIITKDLTTHSFFPICKSTNELPRYFMAKKKSPTQKELQILNRISILRDQLRSINILKKCEDIKNNSYSNRKIFENSSEIAFYQSIINKLGAKK